MNCGKKVFKKGLPIRKCIIFLLDVYKPKDIHPQLFQSLGSGRFLEKKLQGREDFWKNASGPKYKPRSDCSIRHSNSGHYKAFLMLILPIFCPENAVCLFTNVPLLHIFKCTSDKNLSWKQNTMNSDQTAPLEQSVLVS